ncbi:hypothetical protein [Diaphorobacter sp. HDW4B]
MPTEPAAANRATLPQTLDPTRSSTTKDAAPAASAPAPAAAPNSPASAAR